MQFQTYLNVNSPTQTTEFTTDIGPGVYILTIVAEWAVLNSGSEATAALIALLGTSIDTSDLTVSAVVGMTQLTKILKPQLVHVTGPRLGLQMSVAELVEGGVTVTVCVEKLA